MNEMDSTGSVRPLTDAQFQEMIDLAKLSGFSVDADYSYEDVGGSRKGSVQSADRFTDITCELSNFAERMHAKYMRIMTGH